MQWLLSPVISTKSAILTSPPHITSEIKVNHSVWIRWFSSHSSCLLVSRWRNCTIIFLTVQLLNVLLWLPGFYLLSWSVSFLGYINNKVSLLKWKTIKFLLFPKLLLPDTQHLAFPEEKVGFFLRVPWKFGGPYQKPDKGVDKVILSVLWIKSILGVSLIVKTTFGGSWAAGKDQIN